MNIRFVKHRDIDKNKWDSCVITSNFPTIFAKFDFLKIANSDFSALILNDYEAVMPLPVRKKFGIPYIFTPHFVVRLGIFSTVPQTDSITNQFLKAIPFYFFRADLLFHNKIENRFATPIISHQLSLSKDFQSIFENYSDNCKRNLKHTQKQNLKFALDGNVEEIINLFKNNRGKKESVVYKEKDYENLKELATLAIRNQKLEICSVYNGVNELIAGALFILDEERIWFWFSGRDERFSEQKPMFFLLDEYIKLKMGSPFILDFNGSMNPNLARFYSGFGGEKYEVSFFKK